MITLVHASDVHFGKAHLPHVAEAFLRCVHDVDPQVIVVSGDLTQRAKVDEYRAAADFIDAGRRFESRVGRRRRRRKQQAAKDGDNASGYPEWGHGWKRIRG